MKVIKGFNINTNDFPAIATTKEYTVIGDDGAIFSIQVIRDSDGFFYDFKTNTFTGTAQTSTNRLTNKKIEGSFTGSISFPALGGSDNNTTFTIYLFAEPHFETEIDSNLSNNPVLYTTKVKQIQDVTITIGFKGGADKYDISPVTYTTTASPLQFGETVIDVNSKITGKSTATNSFGMTLTKQDIPETQVIWTTTSTVDGATSSSTSVVLDSVDGIQTGMFIDAVTGGSLSGKPVITNVDIPSKTLTLSTSQSLTDGVTLNIRITGYNGILRATGISLEANDLITSLADDNYVEYEDGGTRATKSYHKARTAPSNSTTVTITPHTRGISVGSGVTVRGIGVTNTSTNAIQTVSEDHDASNDGSIVLQVNQNASSTTLKANTELYIDGSSLYATVKGKVLIKSYPTSDQTIYLNLVDTIAEGSGS